MKRPLLPRITRNLTYLHYVLTHKRAVYTAGVRLGVPRWRLLIHDWTKFLPPCADFVIARRSGFVRELMADANRPNPTVLRMDDVALLEMIADWSGAGVAQGTGADPLPWYTANRDSIVLHPETQRQVDMLVGWKAGTDGR